MEAIVEKTKERVNALWKEKQLPKFIQFGRDGKGENSHALNGPTVKAVLRDPTLIIDTIEAMAPVYALMEQGKYQLGQTIAKVKVRTAGAGDGSKVAPSTNKKGSGRPRTEKEVNHKQKRRRGVDFGTVESDESDDDGEQGQGRRGFDGGGGGPPCCETVESEVSAPNLPDELRDAERARKKLTYSQRVGIAFVAFMALYSKLHAGHDRKASDVDEAKRDKLADEAVELAVEMQRTFLALMGTHKRRTYAHDFVYGLHPLYKAFAKPWNAATEGSEHAHQEMKKFFHHLACNNGKGKSSCYQVLKLRLVLQQMKHDYARMLLPWSEYCASRCGKIFGFVGRLGTPREPAADATVMQRKRNHQSLALELAIGEKKYDPVDDKMADNLGNIRKSLCLECD